MACITADGIRFQNEIPIILTTCLEIHTYIKVHHVYKRIWTHEIRKQLKVRIEQENCADKYAVCMVKDKKVVGDFKKGESGKFAKIISYFLRNGQYSSCITTISGKRCNLKDGEDLQVPCKLDMKGQQQHVNILKQEFHKIKELQ